MVTRFTERSAASCFASPSFSADKTQSLEECLVLEGSSLV